MSAIAGIIIFLLGGASLALGVSELMHPNLLPPLSARSTAGLGFILVLIGLLHFRAPHKSFLLSIPLLVFLNVQMYLNSVFYYSKPLWHYLAALAVLSIFVLILSYKGYRQSVAKTQSSLPA